MGVIVLILIAIVLYSVMKGDKKQKPSAAKTKTAPSSGAKTAKSQREYDKETKRLYKVLDDADNDQIESMKALMSIKKVKGTKLYYTCKKLLHYARNGQKEHRDMQKDDKDGSKIRRYLASKEGKENFQRVERYRSMLRNMQYGTSTTTYTPPSTSVSYSYHNDYDDVRAREQRELVDDLERQVTSTERQIARLRREGFVIEADQMEGELSALRSRLSVERSHLR